MGCRAASSPSKPNTRRARKKTTHGRIVAVPRSPRPVFQRREHFHPLQHFAASNSASLAVDITLLLQRDVQERMA
ncbi:hypothetical protein Cob_v010023 [Colletotrichum orbiculare MAFF 240422]|uniref:Uncharacterized protein n=1 Tax=Colletotrichum orbiculare (strain 104-T / ATCC 96160 / CBS 514.97 / LARS 414 / MAFF 240422) TaxID=1213857 RepID=A0A484FFK2_COLOR|nr:hypothetical protein Cob_v010023 [Colletotrichum orbiculare MAFF 240422]